MCTILRKVCVVLFCVVFSTILATPIFGKNNSNYPDIIRLQMPNGLTVEYAMDYRRDKLHRSKLKEKEYPKKLKEKLGNFLKRWQVLGITNLEEKKPLYIEDLIEEIRITERKDSRTILFPKNTKLALTVKGKHKLELFQLYSDFFLYFDNTKQLEELLQYDIEKILKEGDEKLAPALADRKNKRRPLRAWLSVDKENNVGLTYQEFIPKKYIQDYLNLSFTPNVENINGSWLSGIGLNMDLILDSKWRFGLGYEFMYNFTERHTTNISHWANFRAMAKSEAVAKSWVGISFGYLVKQRGYFFDNNKFRLGFPVTYDNFTVTPEIYYKGVFKNSKKENKYFGIKISFNL